jgi:hypothetical protein
MMNPFPFDNALLMEVDGRAGALNLGDDARWLRGPRLRGVSRRAWPKPGRATEQHQTARNVAGGLPTEGVAR